MTSRHAVLPTVPLWLATLIAVSSEAALLAGLQQWATAPVTPLTVPELPLEVSLVAAPVLTDSAVVSAASVPPPKSELPPAPVAEPEPPPVAPITASPAPAVLPIKSMTRPRQRRPRQKLAVKQRKSPAVTRPVAPVKSPRVAVAKGKSAAVSRDAPAAVAPVTSSPAAYLNNPAPHYPDSARRQGVTGTVLLRVLVNASGQASAVVVAQSAGASSLDQAALAAVRRWRFQPARRNGQSISAWVRVPIRFQLKR